LDIPKITIDQVLDNMEELIYSNEGYRQHGKQVANKNLKSSTTSYKSTPSRKKYRTSGIEIRKASAKGSYDGGDKYHQGKILKIPILCSISLK